MSDAGDPLDLVDHRAVRVRRVTIAGCLAFVAGFGLWGWRHYYWEPSAHSVCTALTDLVIQGDERDERERKRLCERLAPGAWASHHRDAVFGERCVWIFDELFGEGVRVPADRGRCLVHSTTAAEASRCLEGFSLGVARERVSERLSATPRFPERRPDMPDKMEPLYDALVEVSAQTLAACDAVFDVERGCYGIDWAGERHRDLAHQIGGPVPADDRLVLLEASCEYDAARWIERYPQLREKTGDFPASGFSCDLLPVGDYDDGWACGGSWNLYSPDASVDGGGGDKAEVWVSSADGCEERLVRVSIVRTDGEGRTVELDARFKGERYEPLPPSEAANADDEPADAP